MGSLKEKSVFKTLIIVVAFFTYNIIISTVMNILGITDKALLMFVPDLVFLIAILVLYGKTIKEDFKKFHQTHKIGKRLAIILGGFAILFIVNIGAGMILDLVFPNVTVDENTTALYSLDTVYTIFKVLIFSVIAEELVFRKSIGEVIDNKIAFVLISSLIYSLTNILYSDLTNLSVWVNAISYFAIYLTLSIIYVKNKDNIYPVMVMKFLLNLIPVAILLSGV